MRKVVMPFKLALASLLFAACVTINVYFPAAAAEKAADQIIDQVTGEGKGSSTPAPPQTSLAPEYESPLRAIVIVALERLVPAAHAQSQANLDISTPEIRAITASMQQRFPQLRPLFDSGAVGLTANGLVEIRDQNAIPLAERANAKRLVADENKDRNSLYSAIASANGHPEWEADIRQTFARQWVARAQAGWYYQDASGGWKQK